MAHGYFETMDVPVVRGRAFEPTDRTGPPVAIVSETAARRFWPGEDPIGRRIRRGSEGEWHTVVGVARDTKVRTLSESPRPYVYLPVRDEGTDFALVLVATRGAPGPFVASLLEEVRALDPAVTPFDSGSIQDQTAIMLYPARMGAILLAAFGALALVLTRLLGGFLYGVSVTDPITFVAIPVLLAGVALLASWLPARRAASQDPMRALRYE